MSKQNILLSNGKDIQGKRNDTLIIGLFSLSKRNELTYSRNLSEAGSKKERTYLVQNLLDRREIEHN